MSTRNLKLFVSRIPWTAANKDLREYFSQFGQIKKLFLPVHKTTGFHKGFCWVTFTTEKTMNRVLEKDSHFLDGDKIQVETTTSPPPVDHSSNRDDALGLNESL